jgi:hypothetical protein
MLQIIFFHILFSDFQGWLLPMCARQGIQIYGHFVLRLNFGAESRERNGKVTVTVTVTVTLAIIIESLRETYSYCLVEYVILLLYIFLFCKVSNY